MEARDAHEVRVDEHEPRGEQHRLRAQLHPRARAVSEWHECGAAHRRQQPLRQHVARGYVRLGRLVGTRVPPIVPQRHGAPVHGELGERPMHIEEEGAVVVPAEEAADVRLIVDWCRRVVQPPQARHARRHRQCD